MTGERNTALVVILNTRFPELSLSENTTFSRVVSFLEAPCMGFRDEDNGLSGRIESVYKGCWGGAVYVKRDSENIHKFLGNLVDDLKIKGPLTELHDAVPMTATDFTFEHSEGDVAVLRTIAHDPVVTIKVNWSTREDSYCIVLIPGAKYVDISNKIKVDMLKGRVCEAITQHRLHNVLYRLNINLGAPEALQDRRRPHIELAFMWHSLYQHADADEKGRHLFAKDGNDFFIFDPLSVAWRVAPLSECINQMIEVMKTFCGGVFWKRLSKWECKYIESTKGGKAVLNRFCVFCKDMLDWMIELHIDTTISFDLTQRVDRQGRKVTVFVKRDDLIDDFKTCHAKFTRDILASTLKDKVEKVMGKRGRIMNPMTTIYGERVSNVFLRCVLKTKGPEDTSSRSERLFRDNLEVCSGIAFEHNVRPEWLMNPVTSVAMELDMYCKARKLAIEYDGPHHYVYPNNYHTDEDEFRAQQARDAAKDEICRQKGVRLIRVRCGDGTAEEVRWCMEQIIQLEN